MGEQRHGLFCFVIGGIRVARHSIPTILFLFAVENFCLNNFVN
jgi:hypothetical protein